MEVLIAYALISLLTFNTDQTQMQVFSTQMKICYNVVTKGHYGNLTNYRLKLKIGWDII